MATGGIGTSGPNAAITIARSAGSADGQQISYRARTACSAWTAATTSAGGIDVDKLMQVFQYNGAQVRVADLMGQPGFCAKDVCEILEIQNARDAVARLDEDERGVVLTDTLGGGQPMTYVTEAGLYALILSSRKPEARQFKRWVTHEVLPQIRKTGMYALVPKTLPEALRAYADEVERRQALEAKIEQDKPKVEFYDTVARAEGLHTMNEAAKILGIGPNQLFALLRGAGVLMTNPRNVPRQEFIQRKYFVTREKTFQKGAGAPQEIYCQTYVTGKGMEFLERFIREHVPQRGFPGHRPGGGKSLTVLRHEYAARAEQLGGLR